jgi:hypothetical protein
MMFRSAVRDTTKQLNSSKVLMGIAMIILNIGSKYVTLEISKNQEHFLKSTIIRRITLFCIFFTATSDLYISLGLTAVFIVLAGGIFNQDSRMYIFNTFYDNEYTQQEYDQSKIIIKAFEQSGKNTK